jgi:guanine nucleotide-binding protein alpha-1 subunit
VLNFGRYLQNLSPLFEIERHLLQQLSNLEDSFDKEATHLPDFRGTSPPTKDFSTYYVDGTYTNGDVRPWRDILLSLNSLSKSSVSSSVSTGSKPSVWTTSDRKQARSLGQIQTSNSVHSGDVEVLRKNPDNPVHVIHACAPYVAELWRDTKVRQRRAEKNVRLDESAGL